MARTSFLTNCPRCGYIVEAGQRTGLQQKYAVECVAMWALCPFPICRINPGESDNIYS